MSRKFRLLLLIALCVAALLIVAIVGLYFAARHEPAFYRRAFATNAAELNEGSKRMVREAAALQSIGQRNGHWEAVITATDINGWLAVDLPKNHPKLLPPTIHDPRVAVGASGVTIGCRLDQSSPVNPILSLKVQPYLSESNVIALRIIRARAGAIPLPLERIIQAIRDAARAADLSLHWSQTDGDPVALLTLSEDEDAEQTVRIEKIELRDGEIRIAGSTRPRKP